MVKKLGSLPIKIYKQTKYQLKYQLRAETSQVIWNGELYTKNELYL